ncbi:MAG TPA: hypothetical protein VLA04_05745 [Verrucomicrobiae bacterium]|nr:hypothetical protein [Verrucomicrobiae bacterium]
MIHKTKGIIEFVDWVGVVLIVGAYLAAVMGTVQATDYRYLVANIVGSVGVAYASWKKKDVQPVVLNLVWILVALIGLLRAYNA